MESLLVNGVILNLNENPCSVVSITLAGDPYATTLGGSVFQYNRARTNN